MNGFFAYPDSFTYSGEDMFSLKHLLLTGVILVAIVVLAILLRKVSHKKIDVFLKIFSIFVVVNEILSKAWRYSYTLSHGEGINPVGDLPLYTCSIFLIVLPLAAWTKGRTKEYSLSFMTTIGIIAGLSNFIYLNSLNWYPLFHYASIYSLYYHCSMVFVGLWLLTSGYVKPKVVNIHQAEIVVILFSAIAIPVTYELFYTAGNCCDYMLYTLGASLPLLGDIATYLRDKDLMFLFTYFVMLVIYPLMSLLVYGISKGVEALTKTKKELAQ